MFKRAFMESFKVRKNANPGCYLGSVSSNIGLVSTKDRRRTRFLVYLIGCMFMINATRDFSVFYEIFYHLPQPATRTYY